MFKQLNLKIKLSILITLATCCIAIYLISVRGVYGVLEMHFSEMADQVLTQKTQNLILFQKRIEAIASQISNEEKLQTLLTRQLIPPSYNDYSVQYKDMTNYMADTALIIDGKILPYKVIEGAAVFSTQGVAITSEGLSPYPLSLLQTDPGIHSFFTSDKEAYWSVRSDNIPDYYRNNRYIEQRGIVSYILKIRDERNVLLGFMSIDINPEYFYESFAPVVSNSLVTGISVSLIGPDSQTVPMENEHLYDGSRLSKDGLITGDKVSYRFIYSLSDSGIRIGLDLPAQTLKKDKFNVLLVSTVILIVALIFSLTIAIIVSKCIVEPIRKLHFAMQHPSDLL